jgi:hypothetical protein
LSRLKFQSGSLRTLRHCGNAPPTPTTLVVVDLVVDVDGDIDGDGDVNGDASP